MSKLVVHVNNHWLGESKEAITALNLIEDTPSKDTTEAKLPADLTTRGAVIHAPADNAWNTTHITNIIKRDGYTTVCNDNRGLIENGFGACSTYLNVEGKGGNKRKCGVGAIISRDNVYVSGSQWEDAKADYAVPCQKVANAIMKIKSQCGGAGGEFFPDLVSADLLS